MARAWKLGRLGTLGLGGILFCLSVSLSAASSRAGRQTLAELSPSGFASREALPPPETSPPQQRLENQKAGLTAIGSALKGARAPNLHALARALGLSAGEINSRTFGTLEPGMKVLGDLDGDSVPEVAVNWNPPARGGMGASAQDLYLLSWDGGGWRASYLIRVANAFEVQVLPESEPGERLLAVVVFRSVTAAPYPVIFRYQDHAARKLWDARAESSLYSGYDYGAVTFRNEPGDSFPEMVVTGRADPGLLVFPKRYRDGGRGFQVTSIYVWRTSAYLPVKTEYSPSPDYTLYRFISALHLHDFKAAYALIEARAFLKTSKPTLKLFRKRVEDQWPEFLDDRIFRVPGDATGRQNHAFTLTRKDGGSFLYLPSFTAGPGYRLTGLQRKIKNLNE